MTMRLGPTKCSEGDCTKIVLSKGKCQTHYERDRQRHRHRDYTPSRAAATRAYGRATAQLIAAHPKDFERLYQAELEAARTEVIDLEERAQERGIPRNRGVPRIMPGPRPSDERPADRLREDVGRCPHCHALHDNGHRCTSCGADLTSSPASEATLRRMVCVVCGMDGRERRQPCIDSKGRRRIGHDMRLNPAAAGDA